MENAKKLTRSAEDRVIAGVCGGLGKYFEVDSLVFRALFLLFAFMGGGGVLLYIVLMILMPKEGETRGGFPEDLSERVQEIAKEMREHQALRPERRKMALGAIFILGGLLLLLNQLFPFTFRWDILGPAVVILIGVALLARQTK